MLRERSSLLFLWGKNHCNRPVRFYFRCGFCVFFFFLLLIISSVQLLSHVQLFVTPWTAAPQASLSITNSRSLLILSVHWVGDASQYLILCCPLLLLTSIFPSIRVFSSESVLHIRWPKHWHFSFSVSPSNKYSGLIFLRIDWFDHLIFRMVLDFQKGAFLMAPAVKNPPGIAGDVGLIPGTRRSAGEGHGSRFQYCLGNPKRSLVGSSPTGSWRVGHTWRVNSHSRWH